MSMFPFGPFPGMHGWPYTDLHTLNLDYYIEETKKNSEGLKNVVETLPDLVEKEVEEYIESHPATGIEDNSIETSKLKKTSIPFYCVTDYGILPNTGDVYRALHDFLNSVVYQTGGIVYFPAGRYTVSFTVFIPENTIFVGDGEKTVIYFNEEDTDFGVALCNAGSNVTIMNMCIEQASTGTFHSGAQVGCIGLGDISHFQCTEPAYSHNYIRASEVHNLAAINLKFIGKYPLQTEPASGKVIDVIYKNIVSSGAVSVQTDNNAEVDNVLIENCTCDIIRIISGQNNKNISIENVVANSLYISNNSDEAININNFYGASNNKQNDVAEHKYTLAGDINIENSQFNESSDITVMIGLGAGIHTFNRCRFIGTNKRAFIREAALSNVTNYDVFNDCYMTSAEGASTSIIIGYGKNNKIEGNITAWLFGNCEIVKTLTGSISTTNPNTWALYNDIFILRYTGVISSATVFTFPQTFVFPINRNTPINVTLWNPTTGACKHTWAKITEGAIVIQENGIDFTAFTRAMIDHVFTLTRLPYPTEIYSLT